MGAAEKFKNKVVLISGAGSGIGLELAKEFTRCGAIVIGTDINPLRVDEMVAVLTRMAAQTVPGQDQGHSQNSGNGKPRTKGYCVDHSKHEQVVVLFNAVMAEFGGVDILCPNAGVGHAGKIGSIPQEEWQWVIDVNIWGVLHMVNTFIPAMMHRKSGWVLLTASGSALLPSAGMAPYNLSKFAVLGLGETMYMELKQAGIDVSVLCPGVIATNIISDGIVHGEVNKQRAVQIYAQDSGKSVHPAVVAQAAVAGLAAGKPLILSPLKQMIIGDILKRVSRKLFLDMGARLFKRGSNFVGPVVGDE